VRIKGAQIGPNQSTKTTTCAVNDFTSFEDLLKPFLTFTTNSRIIWEFLCYVSSSLCKECKEIIMKIIGHIHNTGKT